jgi:hypothetical protein
VGESVTELVMIFRLATSTYIITLALFGYARTRGQPLRWMFLWQALMLAGFGLLTWAIFDTIDHWQEISP